MGGYSAVLWYVVQDATYTHVKPRSQFFTRGKLRHIDDMHDEST